MKRFVQILLLCILCIGLVGCGGKKTINDYSKNDTDKNNDDVENKIDDDTKVTTIAKSYEKFSTLKTEIYDKLNDEMEKSDNYNFSLAMGLLGFSTIDLTMIPLTFCGMEKEAALIGLSFLYAKTEYESTDSNCKISFVTDEGKSTYNTIYDKKSDSVQTKMYENDKLIAISEYIKLDDGYATQFYSNDSDDSSVYKAIFDKNKIIVGMQTKISEPESIYKNEDIVSEEWTKSEELWSKYENGTVTSIYDGQEY